MSDLDKSIQEFIDNLDDSAKARIAAHVSKITLGGRAPVKSVTRKDGVTEIVFDGPGNS